MMTLDEIRNVEFSRGRGYRAEEVDDFIDECVEAMAQLQQENVIVNQKMKALADKLAEYRNDEDSIRAALLNAQRTGDTIIREAEDKAKALLEDARKDADTARRELLAQVEAEQAELARVKREVAAFKETLLALYKTHLADIKLLPDEPAAEVKAPVAEESVSAETAEDSDGTVVVAPAADEPIVVDTAEEMKPMSRFGDLKFGNDYDIKEDADDGGTSPSRGLFRKKNK